MSPFLTWEISWASTAGHHGARGGGAGREGVGLAFVDADFRHRDAGPFGFVAHDADEVGFKTGLGIVRVDHLHAHAHLGHLLAHEQRDDRAAEADDHREDEEGGKVEGRARHGAEVDAEHHLHDREDHAEHDEDGEVGEHQQTNALKHTVPISFFFCVDRMSDACSGNGGRSIAHAAAVHSLLNCMKTRRSICLASSRQL